MRYKRWITITIIILMIVTSFRIIWLAVLTNLFEVQHAPQAEEGVLDLRHITFKDKRTLRLDGEWEFYSETSKRTNPYIQVPDRWNNRFEGNKSDFHYGTYRLKILLGNNHEQPFGLKVNRIRNASAVYVNDELVGSSNKSGGKVTKQNNSSAPYTVILPQENGIIDLMIQVKGDTKEGGIIEPLRFGTMESIETRTNLSIRLQLLLGVVLLLHGLYALAAYFLGIRNKGLLYFSLVTGLALLSVYTADDKLLFNWLPLGYEWEIKIAVLSYIFVMAFIPLFIKQLLPDYVPRKVITAFGVFAVLYALFVLLATSQVIFAANGLFLSSIMIFSAYLCVYILWHATKNKEDIIFLLLASVLLLNNIIWAVINANLHIEDVHYPFDLIFVMLFFTAYWLRLFFRATESTKRLNKQLQKEQKRKDQFLINTSHELRNPLHGMINLTEAMLMDKERNLTPKQQKQLELFLIVSKRLSLLVEDLLDITRLNEQTIHLKKQAIRLPSIVTGVFDLLSPTLEGKNIDCQIDIEDDFPLLWGDETRLVQVIYNLLHNAAKFTNEGRITFRASVVDGWAKIDIQDTGIGIEQKEIEKMFEPYEQGQWHASNYREGIGIGLSICRQLVEMHGGTIQASAKHGAGSMFCFTFPLADKATITEDAKSIAVDPNWPRINENISDHLSASQLESDKTLPDRNILIVDDDSINLNVLQYLLESEKFTVMKAQSAHEALNMLTKHSIDIVISDVMMPIVSGYELTREIRKTYSPIEMPILLITARDRVEDILTGFQAGANDYLTKPVHAWELNIRVRALMELKNAMEEHVRMENAWMQSQIQPHFIFNVLNSIAALSVIDTEKMHKLLDEFSHYLRVSFDFTNADPVVPIEHELHLVRSYIYIEKVRFNDRVQINWHIDPNLNICIPPLSIQPLVENAINHGILKQTSGGIVTITIKQEDAHYVLMVEDNGIGMSEEKMQRLFRKPIAGAEDSRTSVGLRNINRRLKQLYNQRLQVNSVLHEGTAIGYKIPSHLAKPMTNMDRH